MESTMKAVTLDDVLSEMKTKAPRRYKRLKNQLDKRVERIYYATCSGIQIDIMDIGKVFEFGRQKIIAGDSDEALAVALRAYVETLRKN